MSLRYPRRGTLLGLASLILSILYCMYLLPNCIGPWYESRYQMTSGAFRHLRAEGLNARFEGRYEDAEKLMLESLDYAVRTYGSQHLLVAESAFHLARLYELQGKNTLARQYFNQTIAISSELNRLPYIMTEAQILLRISFISLEYKEYEIAIEYARRTIDVVETSKPEDKSLLLDPLLIIAETYEEQQYLQREEVIRKRIITINEELVGKAELALLKSLHHYGTLLDQLEKYDESNDALLQGFAIANKYRDATGEEFQEILKLYPHAPGPTEKNKKEKQMPQ